MHCFFKQVATYAVATGALCLVVFRALSGLPFGAIWEFTQAAPHFHVDFRHILLGGSQSFGTSSLSNVNYLQTHLL